MEEGFGPRYAREGEEEEMAGESVAATYSLLPPSRNSC